MPFAEGDKQVGLTVR